MRNVLKWAALTIAGLAVIVAGLVLVAYLVSGTRINRTYALALSPITFRSDAEAVTRGKRLATIRGCTECHGEDLAGRPFIDDPALGTVYATNLTRGQGGAASTYSDEDWDRAVRHGVRPNGRALLVMPSQEFNVLSDQDLADIVAFARSLKPVDRFYPPNTVRPVGRLLHVAGLLPLVPAEVIDHASPRKAPPTPGATPAYGEYLATSCIGCHQPDFGGGKVPGSPPDMPPSANLTPDRETGIGAWTEDQFLTALKTGKRPDGRVMDPKVMPWTLTAHMTDDEIRAVYLYLRTLPPVKR